MAWTEKHKTEELWRGRWRNSTTRRKDQTDWLPYQGQALWLAELGERGQLEDGEDSPQGPASPRGVTVGEYVAGWLQRVRGTVELGTWKSYRSRMGLLAGTRLNGLAIKDVTWDHVESWRRNLDREGLAASTANHAFLVFTIMFRDAYQRDAVDSDKPILKHGRIKGKTRKVWVLDADEEADFLAAAEADGLIWWQQLVIQIDTGLRWGEVVALTPQAIHADSLDVLATVKTGRTTGTVKGTNHSGADEAPRTVPTTPRVQAILKPLVAQAKLKGGRKQLLWTSKDGRPIHPDTYQDHFDRIAEAAFGVDGADLVGHHLRHTFATRCRRKGLDVVDIQYLLGHKDIRTTKGYITIGKEDHDRMAAAIAS